MTATAEDRLPIDHPCLECAARRLATSPPAGKGMIGFIQLAFSAGG